MRPLLIAVLACAAATGAAAELQREPHLVNQRPVTVSNRNEITIQARDDQAVRNRELWYSRFENGGWGEWQKHGITFSRDTAITWAPPEGHWRIFVRIEEISGLVMPQPDERTEAAAEFIIDRTPPAVQIDFPADGTHLRGGQTYQIRWTVSDPHLHSTPITIRWARAGEDTVADLAEHIADTGSFEWTTPLDMTANGRLQIHAVDRAGNTGSAAVGEVVIDAIAPSRNILGPAISASHEVDLAVRAQDAGPSGLARVQLYYSADGGASWHSGPVATDEPFTSVAWTAPGDGSYRLALVAHDRAGNGNPLPKGPDDGQFTTLVDTEAPSVVLSSPIGVVDPQLPADALPRRVFKPGDRVEVRFTINDANVRDDGVNVLLQPQEGGRWEVIGRSHSPAEPFAFTIPDLATGSARIKVQAVDVAGNQGEAVASETFSVDNEVEAGAVQVDL